MRSPYYPQIFSFSKEAAKYLFQEYYALKCSGLKLANDRGNAL